MINGDKRIALLANTAIKSRGFKVSREVEPS
jgi:hypothetical protein